MSASQGIESQGPPRVGALEVQVRDIAARGPADAARTLSALPPHDALDVLGKLNPGVATDLLVAMDDQDRARLLAAAPPAVARQWQVNLSYPDGSIGRLLEAPTAVFAPTQRVAEVVADLRELVKTAFITYCWVVDASGRLIGVVTMRDLLLAPQTATLAEVMLRDVFSLRPETPLPDAMREVVHKHYPVYPVCDSAGTLVGLVRGHAMFEEQAFEISAQPGRMVGVDKEERLGTPWHRSLVFRHPWLQLNLVTAFVAAGVVGLFQNTLDQMVILALFLPVLAGQSGNTGCQALAVTLRGMTLGEFRHGTARVQVSKEALLGLLNGTLVGLTAGAGMFVVATLQSHPQALGLGAIVLVAMVGSCVVSGISGALIPMTLKRVGADPATASSIFLTTATDVVSMGMLLGLATLLLL